MAFGGWRLGHEVICELIEYGGEPAEIVGQRFDDQRAPRAPNVDPTGAQPKSPWQDYDLAVFAGRNARNHRLDLLEAPTFEVYTTTC